MRLTFYSDYSLRLLMYLAVRPERLSTIKEIAETIHLFATATYARNAAADDVELTNALDRAVAAVKKLRVRIAVDDFGTGYSTLATLQQFPLDAIKIDRSFVRQISESDHDNSLTEAIIGMGRALSLTVIAKGVETREQADFLRDRACDEFQGFYLNKPVPADQVTDLLKHQFAMLATSKSAAREN